MKRLEAKRKTKGEVELKLLLCDGPPYSSTIDINLIFNITQSREIFQTVC